MQTEPIWTKHFQNFSNQNQTIGFNSKIVIEMAHNLLLMGIIDHPFQIQSPKNQILQVISLQIIILD